MSLSKEVIITRTAIGITLAGGVMSMWTLFSLLVNHASSGSIWNTVVQGCYILFAGFIIFSGLVYQFARLGHLKRLMKHRQPSQDELDILALGRMTPQVAFLIPSYKEEKRVIQQSLLSAALQEYPDRRVVLLIDDPPDSRSLSDMASLAIARRLPLEIQQMLETEAKKYHQALTAFLDRRAKGDVDDLAGERATLAHLYEQVARWYENAASLFEVTDHTDGLFVDKIFLERSRRYFEIAGKVRSSPDYLNTDSLAREYERLDSLFRVELTYFERKRYVNLSHESNKAMNLNSYIGLMGRSFREIAREDGVHLEPASPSKEALNVPDADYVITLDADSLLLPEYALKLIHVMEQPENERIAVVQTPYSAIPNPASIVERIAGATTDIQCLIHQGFTHFGATYWVGANAVLRKAALADICVVDNERGFPVVKYIQDRTVIEDTESTIDMVARGWKLYNYPERLSYTATPPDFGSLLIQRRRWSNGGLIILPKLLRYLLSNPFRSNRLGEGLMRINYLTSIAVVNLGLLLMLVYPFQDGMQSFLLPLASLPYFYLYRRDMIIIGYRASDFFRVYALNLMLLPVNLAGVLKSLQQAICGHKVPFGRTPKVQGRTSVPPFYLLALYGLLLLSISAFIMDILHGRYSHSVFCLINSGFFLYVVVRYIGLKDALEDVVSNSFLRSLKGRWRPVWSNPATGTLHAMRGLQSYSRFLVLVFIGHRTITAKQ